MSEKELVLRSTIHYYCYRGFYRSMQNAALEGVRLYANEHKYRFYYGISLTFEGRIQESIRELDALQDNRDLSLGCLLALIHAHRQCKAVDKEAIGQFEVTLRDTRKSANETSLYFAGLFLMFIKKFEKARDYVDRMYKMAPSFREGLIAKGWLELEYAKEMVEINEVAKYFDAAANHGDPEALLGKAAITERTGNYGAGVEYLNRAIANYHAFVPAFIEKIKLHVAMKDWEDALDTIARTQNLDRHCIDAKRYSLLHTLVWETLDDDQSESKLSDLLASLELREPKNLSLFLENAKLYSRLAGRNKDVLHITLKFAEKAAMLDANNADVLCEMGFQYVLLRKFTDAQRHFKNATKFDQSNLSALVGLLYNNILENPSNSDAIEQLDALEEFNHSQGLTNELLYLCALTGEKRGKTETEVLKYLDQIAGKLIDALNHMPVGLDFYMVIDPEMTCDVVQLYLEHAPADPISHGQPLPHVLKMSNELLSPVINSCPSLKQPLFLMASVKYLSGDFPSAMSLLDKSLELRQPFCHGYLLKAKLLVSQGQWRTASQCLEQALSIDFQIRDNMDYILTRSILLKQEKKYEEAINVLQNASNSNSELTSSLTKRNKISRYLQLVELYDLLEQSHEASNLLDELDEQFKGTANEGRILMARADSYLKKGSVDESLGVLRTIGTEYGEYFIKSRETMAQIYLKYRKDRRLYASCYRDILEKAPSTQAYLMLGDAYMNILEPERAIEIYEQCLKKNPRDGALTRKVGQALVTTHQFDKAVTYYKAAIKQIGHCSLRYDLAYLLFRMKRFTDSKDVILAAIEKLRHAGLDLTAMDWEAKLLYLLCKVQLVTDSRELAVTTLQETHAIHNKVIRRIPIEQPDLFPEHKKLAVEIGMLLADFLASYQEFERAKHTLKELLLTDAENVKVLGELARLEMITDNFDEAQKYTNSIVKFAPDDNTSVLMLADVMLRKNDMEGAMEQYSQIMEKKPTSFVALARYIEVARRTGKLDSVPALFTKAEEVSPRCINGSEYNFCKGLYQWYMGENVEAMHSFNTARADPLFGTVALINMIEICINPDNQVIGSAAQQANEFDVTFIDQVSSLQDSVVTAQSLLMDLRPRIGNGPDFSILANFILIARSTKVDVDMALGEFSTMLREEKTKNSAGAILGAATAHMLLKQVAKAKNILKRINKLTWNYEEAEYFERSWLLLADIYCQSQKYEPTRQLVEKCIVYNQSCFKAYEYLALIKESESNYREACKNYLISWHLTGESNPTTGYKLAANYMKCKNYVEAIDVARQVLVKYPEYPRIRKEIIEKARIYLKF